LENLATKKIIKSSKDVIDDYSWDEKTNTLTVTIDEKQVVAAEQFKKSFSEETPESIDVTDP
jgi:hypothetical protein